MSGRAKVIIIRETAWKSWLSDASTFGLFCALIGVGWLLDSSAMQWAGAIVAFLSIIGRSLRDYPKLTISEARIELDRLEKSK